jgi:hypothetical protein
MDFSAGLQRLSKPAIRRANRRRPTDGSTAPWGRARRSDHDHEVSELKRIGAIPIVWFRYRGSKIHGPWVRQPT